MINNKKSSNYTLFLILLLILPFKSFHLYYVLSFILIVMFTFNVKLCWSSQAKFLALFIIYYFLMSVFRFFSTFEPNIRDFIEIFRFLPLLYLVLERNYFKGLRYEDVVKACFVYLLIDGAVTFMQYFGLNYLKLVSIVHDLYTSDAFFESLDMIHTRRSPGISSQIGEHGAIMMSMVVIMLSATMNKCNLKLMSFVGIVLSLTILILNQSRTSFVATVIAMSFLMIYYLLFGSYAQKLKITFISSILVSVCIVIIIKYEDISFKIHYLYKLSKLKNTLAAATTRLDKWGYYFSIAEERIWWFFTGWGKDYFGNSSASFDNDYLHIFFVYSPMILMLLIMFLVYYIFKTLIFSKKYVSRNFEMTFFFVLMGGLIIAGGACFIMYPQIIYLLFFLYCGKYWENNTMLILSKRNCEET